ncbi:Cof-type HAD-IIB family hydrolase [Malacoplasma penetrans]|uniref:Haloacid dehalogenase-like hydrolase n=1 Tax=Malacoplasma penetrans (strain HF-2) TaxID=272633 RepID=Q8EUB1_MALP2|nr:Cof-type HAD-IIB family hydrolase [Malacoplasma penetrans]RXY96858.1 Cof-type HAD-IIB family hydrolase [Malacoplasma penetrans]BAC44805.1 haloacid dehalogenase-like hydrolase [Malacoplasma penetrans HF-2]
MYTKCIYFDIDGTLVPDGVTLTNKTIMAIRYLKDKNIKIGLATGRNIFFAEYFAKVLDVDMPLVCVNGAWIVTPKDYLNISTKYIDFKPQLQLLDVLYKEKKDFLVYTIDGVYSTSENQPFYKRLLSVQEKLKEKKIKSRLVYEMKVNPNLVFYSKQKLLKVLICYDNVSEKIKYENILSNIPNLAFSVSQNGIIDIYNGEVDKANGIEYAINNFRINKREVMVFGDNDNDLNMMKTFKMSVALKNADYQIRKAATYTTDFTCEEEGVADFIFKHF